MPDSPVFGYNPDPRFSVNHLTDYMATTNASQREKVIQDAKFPRKKPITAYQLPRREIQRFFTSGKGDVSFFDLARSKLEHTIQVDEERRAEARQDLKALDAFIALYKAKRWNKLEMGLSGVDVPVVISKVPVNVRLNATLFETSKEGVRSSGGIVLFMAQTANARKNIEERRRQVCQLILWALETNANVEPLPRLCMSMDVFGGEIVKAQEVSERFRDYARSACREAARSWDAVQPPANYDGPPLRRVA
jgi:hypothetical protein